MQREQRVLPKSDDGTMNNCRAPARWNCQAIGYKGHTEIEYLIDGTTGGLSDESGEELQQVFVLKTEQYKSDTLGPGYPYETRMQLYINDKGDAYRTWKGKLKGRPVCNFFTGVVYSYNNYGIKVSDLKGDDWKR